MINPNEQVVDTVLRHDKKIESLEIAVQGILLVLAVKCIIENAKNSIMLAKDIAEKCNHLFK